MLLCVLVPPSSCCSARTGNIFFLSWTEKQKREKRYDMTNPDRDCVTKRGAGSKLDASVLLLAFFLSGLAMGSGQWTRISQDTGMKRSHPEE